ncbi:MAG: hypothetical protein DRN96_00455 [Thermoproteota archaeon]|nr:MAG: hypothetical protein DRN96_00455 [Candidatus Korarchaeota archaeon]RLG55143.1 MAG: hypothetical protein DRN99_03535 [Candidatus Korarchaeota archaeon]
MKVEDVRVFISIAFVALFVLLLKYQLEMLRHRPELRLLYLVVDVMILVGFLLPLLARKLSASF